MVAAAACVETVALPVRYVNSPQRWAHALDHALHEGVEVYVTPTGQHFASSGTHLDLIYAVSEVSCECEAANEGDPVCSHRAALRYVHGTLPAIVLHVDDLALAS